MNALPPFVCVLFSLTDSKCGGPRPIQSVASPVEIPVLMRSERVVVWCAAIPESEQESEEKLSGMAFIRPFK